MKVFLVEDSQAIRDRLKTTIKKIGGEIVGEAGSEREAIDGLLNTRPDLAIVDLSLAEGNGIAVVRQSKKAICGITIVILTEHNSRDFRIACKAAGADYFFGKSGEYLYFEKLLEGMVNQK